MTERVYVALDLETTGLNADRDAIIEIGAVRIVGDSVTDRFAALVNPGRPIPLRIQQLTGIRNEDVSSALPIDQVLPELLSFVRGDVRALVAHNASFDIGFLQAAGVNFHRPALDTFELASILLPGMASYSLGDLCAHLKVNLRDAHRALDDAEATANLFLRLRERLYALPPTTLTAVVAAGRETNWSPFMLFEEAARLSYQTANGADPPILATGDRTTAWELASNALVRDEGAPPAAVDEEWLDHFFAPEGPLAALLGEHFEIRSGQIEMARQVLQTLNIGDHLLVEAGTGVGKSLAYLLPAALWSLANDRRIVVATNTLNLQDQLIDHELPHVQAMLAGSGLGRVEAALLKGRSNYLCTRRLGHWMRGRHLSPTELSVLARVLVWLPTTQTGDVAELFLPTAADRAVWEQICSDAATCTRERCLDGKRRDFYLEARERAERAQLLVINHALLMADLATEGRALPPYSHLIVDEAHHLEDAATEQLMHRITWPATYALLARLALDKELPAALLRSAGPALAGEIFPLLADLSRLTQQAIHDLRAFAERLRQSVLNHQGGRAEGGYSQRVAINGRLRSQPMWSELEIEWDNVSTLLRRGRGRLAAVVDTLDGAGWHLHEPEAAYLAELRGVQESLDQLVTGIDIIVLQAKTHDRQNIVTWLEIGEGGGGRNSQEELTLLAAPLFVGDTVEQGLIRRRRSVIFTGATLRTGASFRFIRERLGLWDVRMSSVESPFDYRASTLLYMPSNMPPPDGAYYQQALEGAIVDAAEAAGGRTLVLFTSYTQLRTTADAIRPALDRLGITLLQHGTSSRNRLLREYRQSERAVLLGTRSFWEGVDLAGDQLSVLVIARLPFAVPNDPLVSARSAEFDDPFNEYTLPDAILRFRQGFGRLIRRSTDRGVVVLLDSRLWQKSYGGAFLDALPDCNRRSAPLANLGAEVARWLERPSGQST